MTAYWINAFPDLDVGWNRPPFHVLKIKIYANFYPVLYSRASKTVCISMTNPSWASTQTLKSKVGISIGKQPYWHLTVHPIYTQLFFVSGSFHCSTTRVWPLLTDSRSLIHYRLFCLCFFPPKHFKVHYYLLYNANNCVLNTSSCLHKRLSAPRYFLSIHGV